jgi:hypothetical protein
MSMKKYSVKLKARAFFHNLSLSYKTPKKRSQIVKEISSIEHYYKAFCAKMLITKGQM